MKVQVGDKIMDRYGYEREVEDVALNTKTNFDFSARSDVGGWMLFREDQEGLTWVPADDLEGFAAMLAMRAMA